MKTSSLLILLVMLTPVAGWGTMTDPLVPDAPEEAPLQHAAGRLSVGYATNYDFRGLIPLGVNTTSPVHLDWKCDLNENYAFVLGAERETFLQEPAIRMEDETQLDAGVQGRFGLTHYSLGYRMTHGGFAGAASHFLNHNTLYTQELAFTCRRDLEMLKGFYAQVSVSYAFMGIVGWWADACLGSDTRVSEHLRMGFQYGMTSSASYWSYGGNGLQAMFFRVHGLYSLTKDIGIEPFISVHWLGGGARRLNRNYSKPLVKGTSWAAGLNVVYSF